MGTALVILFWIALCVDSTCDSEPSGSDYTDKSTTKRRALCDTSERTTSLAVPGTAFTRDNQMLTRDADLGLHGTELG